MYKRVIFGSVLAGILVVAIEYSTSEAADPPAGNTQTSLKNNQFPILQGADIVKLDESPEYNKLNSAERRVLEFKDTERAGTGTYTKLKQAGTYICRRCNAPLYNSEHKFESHCGWPSFDDELPDAVARNLDADGSRVEIVCKNCGGHLGHVFDGEQFTLKNTRHCVNSISMKFVPKGKEMPEVIRPKKAQE